MQFLRSATMMEMNRLWKPGGTDRRDRTATLLGQSQPHRLLCYIGVFLCFIIFSGGGLEDGSPLFPLPPLL